MSKEKKMIAAFIEQMREQHSGEMEGIQLPEGTADYVSERMEEGDLETLLFMLKLGYLMGLQTGVAASASGGDVPPGGSPIGPLQA